MIEISQILLRQFRSRIQLIVPFLEDHKNLVYYRPRRLKEKSKKSKCKCTQYLSAAPGPSSAARIFQLAFAVFFVYKVFTRIFCRDISQTFVRSICALKALILRRLIDILPAQRIMKNRSIFWGLYTLEN